MPIAPSEKPSVATAFKPAALGSVVIATTSAGATRLAFDESLPEPAVVVTVGAGDDGFVVNDHTGAAILTVGEDTGGVFVSGNLATSGQVQGAAANQAGNMPELGQLSSYLTITSGALPNTGAWVSGTAKQNPVARQITVNVVVVMDGTANAASCTIAISSDNTTFTTIGAPGVSAAINTVGAETLLIPVNLPAAWYVKLTLVHCSVAASVYY